MQLERSKEEGVVVGDEVRGATGSRSSRAVVLKLGCTLNS